MARAPAPVPARSCAPAATPTPSRPDLEQPEIRRRAGAERLEVARDADDPAALGVDARLRLDLRRDEHPARRRERAVAIQALLVPQQLIDTRDLTDAFDLDHDGLAVAVAAQQVHRAEVGG